MQTYINLSLSQDSSYESFISSRSKQVYKEVFSAKGDNGDKQVIDIQHQMWCMSFMHVIHYILRMIFGTHLFTYLDSYIEANKEWFLDKVNVIICLLAHDFSLNQIETVVYNHFGGPTIPPDHIYAHMKYKFLKSMLLTSKTSERCKGRPSYPEEIKPILTKYTKVKNKMRMRKVYHASTVPILTSDEIDTLMNLCTEHIPSKTILKQKLEKMLNSLHEVQDLRVNPTI
jgi:hypothetical protein